MCVVPGAFFRINPDVWNSSCPNPVEIILVVSTDFCELWSPVVLQLWNLWSCDCFVGCFDNISLIVSLYSQGTPNTCLAVEQQFDLWPFVVIGGPGVVIHGLFDCWHVKCSVPIPEAEPWFAGSFIFSSLTSDPVVITGSWRILTQQQCPAHLAIAVSDVWSQTAPCDEEKKDF